VFARVRSYWLDDDARHANPNLEIVFSSSSGLFLLLFLFVFIYICVQLLSAAREVTGLDNGGVRSPRGF
jgi:hypothetical protein